MTYDCPFFEYNPATGELSISAREGDKVTGATVVVINLGNIKDVIRDLQHEAKREY